jgi:hypothetical protein
MGLQEETDTAAELQALRTLYGTPLASAPSIRRVFVTSSGVVHAAAKPPHTEPHIIAWTVLTG